MGQYKGTTRNRIVIRKENIISKLKGQDKGAVSGIQEGVT